MALDVLNVVKLWGERVVDVDDDDLPVGLALIEQGHDAEDLDLLDLASVADGLADLAHVQRVVVAFGLGLRVRVRRVFPGLSDATQVTSASEADAEGHPTCGNAPLSHDIRINANKRRRYSLVPDVAVVRKAVADEAELALLGVLQDRVEGLRPVQGRSSALSGCTDADAL